MYNNNRRGQALLPHVYALLGFRFWRCFVIAVLSGLMLSACVDDLPSLDVRNAGGSRFDVNSYYEGGGQSDLSGVWIAIHEGTLLENSSNVDYEISGFIREIVEIRERSGAYYLRTCLEPEKEQLISQQGEQLSVTMNMDVAILSYIDNQNLQGTASHNESDSSYSGSVEMRKVADLGAQFGDFVVYDHSSQTQQLEANCFQEGAVYVLGSMLGISQWARVEIMNMAHYDQDNFYTTGFLVSREGTADAVRNVVVQSGVLGSVGQRAEYESGICVDTSAIQLNQLQSQLNVSGEFNGAINLSFDIGNALLLEEGEGDAMEAEAPELEEGFDWGNWFTWGESWGSWDKSNWASLFKWS